jgi:menaquinone-dependent protoporphyrinogen oxidase
MSRILVFYATTDGHTAKIAQRLGEDLREAGATVHVADAGVGHVDPQPRDYDAVIVAASLHFGEYQSAIDRWVRRRHQELTAMPTAFLSVGLAMLQPEADVLKDLGALQEHFFATTRWRPTFCRNVAGALPFSRYGWLRRRTVQKVARKAGMETDTSRDYEFTDWDELRAFAQQFVLRVERARRVPAAY